MSLYEGKILKSVRGATGIAKDKKEIIIQSVHELFEQLVSENNLKEEAIVNVIFSVTRDVCSINVAGALRKFGFSKVPLFCVQEPYYKGSTKHMIRVLVTYYTDEAAVPVPIYINGAEKLRPDLARK